MFKGAGWVGLKLAAGPSQNAGTSKIQGSVASYGAVAPRLSLLRLVAN